MKVSILNLAIKDLKEINRYLSEFGENPPKKFEESFKKFCIQISDMPYMFNQYEYNIIYRKAIIIYDYLVFYKVDEESNTVKIYRVLYGKRNIESLLN